jgi:hypothetical protein
MHNLWLTGCRLPPIVDGAYPAVYPISSPLRTVSDFCLLTSAPRAATRLSTGRLLALGLTTLLGAPLALAAPIPVTLEQTPGGYRLLRGGEPYFIKGAGGSTHLDKLVASGGNSVRTWGIEQTERLLPEIERLGLTVAAGLWIEHERHGFDYDDPAAVAAQIARHKQSVDRIRDHPAILLWGIGNEVWINARNPKVWDVIEAVAAYIKEVDPHRPTMTVLPHVSQTEVRHILARCPSIDILGINSYGGINVALRQARAYGWTGPLVLAEWGNNGPWEVAATPWGAEIELTSTQKAQQFAERYTRILEDRGCLGGYAFLWGQKQENTPTWFNLFLENGAATGIVDTLQYLWTGQSVAAAAAAPVITPLLISGQPPTAGIELRPAQVVDASFTLVTPAAADVTVRWECLPESDDKREGGDKERRPPPVPIVIEDTHATRIAFTAPAEPGAYRLFVYVETAAGKAATANTPFLVVPHPAPHRP